MSQEDLAEKIGVSVRTIGKIESGRTRAPRPFTVRLLADAFGLSGPEARLVLRERPGERGIGRRPRGSRHRPSCRRPPGFVGRDHQLTRLDTRGASSTCPGPAGGHHRTGPAWARPTLAVYWAHRQRHRFPDGQL
jgi:DNA-binding XRE family transcriptional regulator